MSREVRRVPLDFDYPLGETWSGYLMPGSLDAQRGHERYPGQRAEAEAWTGTGPPAGDGYQLWQTVTEGGPVSPVFATPTELADWIIASGEDLHGSNAPREDLIRWVADGGVSAGSMALIPGAGMVSGVELAARRDEPNESRRRSI